MAVLIVKDLSRFGRNYLQVGYYTEVVFPKKGIRFIAINNSCLLYTSSVEHGKAVCQLVDERRAGGKTKHGGNLIRKGEGEDIRKAVSYTHLDVYKRQVHLCHLIQEYQPIHNRNEDIFHLFFWL